MTSSFRIKLLNFDNIYYSYGIKEYDLNEEAIDSRFAAVAGRAGGR